MLFSLLSFHHSFMYEEMKEHNKSNTMVILNLSCREEWYLKNQSIHRAKRPSLPIKGELPVVSGIRCLAERECALRYLINSFLEDVFEVKFVNSFTAVVRVNCLYARVSFLLFTCHLPFYVIAFIMIYHSTFQSALWSSQGNYQLVNNQP